MPITPKKPDATPEPPADPYVAHDNVAVKRLALQGHRSAARALVRRGKDCETMKVFLETFLTANERERLSVGQFDVLSDAYEEQWASANRDTVALPNVSKSNLMNGWGKDMKGLTLVEVLVVLLLVLVVLLLLGYVR